MASVSGALKTIECRPVAEDDGEFLLRLYASTREEEMEFVDWSDDRKRAFLQNQLAAQKAEYGRRWPEADHEIVLADGTPAGMIWVGRTEDEIRLLDIALLPEFRRRGIGTALLKPLQEEAERDGKPMRHCVYITNTPAFAFYHRLGFKRVKEMGMYCLMEWNSDSTTS